MNEIKNWVRRNGTGKVVVLIHGIGAKDHVKYWRCFLEVLKTDEQLKNSDIFVWGYPTHIGVSVWKNFLSTIRNLTLRETAPSIGLLGTSWEATYRVQLRDYREVILICHSMGGLVAKSWIINALSHGKSKSLDQLRHITFYATPHNGAPVATISAWNKQLEDMRLDNPFIGELRDDWYEKVVAWKDVQPDLTKEHYNRFIPHLVIIGTQDDVVPDNFATITGMPSTHVNADHSKIIQPQNKNDLRYKAWQDALQEMDFREPAYQTLDLARAQDGLISELGQITGATLVEIQHIGLDMYRAKQKMFKMLEKDLHVMNAKLKLLVITSDRRELNRHCIPPFVLKVVNRVEQEVKDIIDVLENPIYEQYQRQGNKLSVEIRSYAELPSIHGFSLLAKGDQQIQRRIVTYCSYCRWNQEGTDLDWGGTGYQQIVGESEDSASQDKINNFQGTFIDLWNNSKLLYEKVIG